MTGEDVRHVFEARLPRAALDRLCRQCGVIEGQRILDLGRLVRALVISAGTPGGAYQADVLRSYLEGEVPPVARSAFYRWFDEPLARFMAALAERAVAYARAPQVDLAGPLCAVTDWYIIDSTTVRVRDALREPFPGTGKYAAIKGHNVLAVGCGAPVRYHVSPTREHDSPPLTIDESWRGYGLLADLGYARSERLRGCEAHHVHFVIRLKDNWKPKVDYSARGQVPQTFFPGTNLDALLAEDILRRDGRAMDADVHVGGDKPPLPLRLSGVHTPKGDCFFLTNLPPAGAPRTEAPLHPRRLALPRAVSCQSIAQAFDLQESEATQRWDKIAALLTHSGKDPNWRRRPSVLDQLRGWKRQPVVHRQSSQHHLKAVA
jgi:Transposase DDE domain